MVNLDDREGRKGKDAYSSMERGIFDRNTETEDCVWRRLCPISGHCF
jgi:hypothetical protein